MKIEIQERGVMMVDYFCGTPGVMLPIPVDNQTTLEQLVEALESEINLLWDHIESIAQYHKFDGNLEKEIEKQISKMKEYVKDRKTQIAYSLLDFNFETEIEDDLESNEYPVCIFSIEFIEED